MCIPRIHGTYFSTCEQSSKSETVVSSSEIFNISKYMVILLLALIPEADAYPIPPLHPDHPISKFSFNLY